MLSSTIKDGLGHGDTVSTLCSSEQCEHGANVQCWSTCDGEMCAVSCQSQLLCLCHGGGGECGELDCIKSGDNCTVNDVEQHFEKFVSIVNVFPQLQYPCQLPAPDS